MIYSNIEFHNVAELESVKGMPGLRLQRFPKEIRNSLGHLEHERGRFYSQVSVGCEIRFVTDAKFIRASLSAYESDGTVLVYKGDFLHSFYKLKAGIITTLHLDEPESYNKVDSKALKGSTFSSSVWRLMFGKESNIIFHNIDTFGHAIRYPQESEIPSLKWLAYGSSITYGGDTTVYSNSYVQQAARRLNIDVLNKGTAGSCFCDESISSYISENSEWDLLTLELGINMVSRFQPEEFEQRAKDFIQKIMNKNPEKTVVAISIFPNWATFSQDIESKLVKNNRAFSEILHRIVEETKNNHLHFIDGKDILTDFSGLTTDLLHPSDYGHIIMGENLANKLRTVIRNI